MNNHIIEAEDLHKSYFKKDSKDIEVLRGISVKIERGKITIILGASGAGKSTLLHVLSGLDAPDKGRVIFEGQDISKLDDARLSRLRNESIGFIFQFHHLIPEFTALENVAIPQLIAGRGFNQSKKRSKELLEIVGMGDRLNHKPGELSGGEQQRVAVARALANNPAILFADEPTGNLDSENGRVISDLFKKINSELGITILMVTHNEDLIELGDIVYKMRDGILHKEEGG